MPELPEVEDAARRLRAVVVGRTLERITVRHTAYRRRLPRALAAVAEGRRVLKVERRGKHQVVHLEGDVTLVTHFRMTGDWSIGNRGEAPHRFARALLDFEGDVRVALVDPRALGTITVHRGDVPLPPIGAEPLDDSFTPAGLRDALARRRIPIKVALLDQRVVAGVGNIYAAESLWRAKIDPRTPANALETPALRRLTAAIRRTLELASRAPARYQDGSEMRFKVYDREGRPCRRCRAKVARIIQGARSTYFCPKCQT